MSASNGQESLLSNAVTIVYLEETCIKTNCSLTPTTKETRALDANLTAKNLEKKLYLAWKYSGNESAEGIRTYQIHLASSTIHYRQMFFYGNFTSSPSGHYVEGKCTPCVIHLYILTYSQTRSVVHSEYDRNCMVL